MNSPVYKTINSAALYLEETLGPKLGPSCSGRPKKLLALLNLTLPQLNEAITRHYRTAILNGGIPDIGISHFVRLVKRAESAHLTSTREHALSLQQASSAPSACVSHAGSADQATADVRSAPPLPRPVPVRLNGALPCPPSAPIPVGQRDGQWASPDHGGWVFRNSGPHPECRHPYPAKPIRGGNAVPVPCSSNMQRQQQEPPLQQAMRRAAAQRAAFKELTERLRKSNPDKRPGLFIKGKWCPLALATRRVRQRGQAFDQQRPVSTQVGTLTVNAKSDSSVSSAAEKGQSPDGFIA